jgi:orotidine-5'-phosphate decarboxylase
MGTTVMAEPITRSNRQSHHGIDESLTADKRLIVALDFDNLDDAMKLVTSLDGLVSFYKVGLELFVSSGLEAVKALRDRGYRAFFDLKMNDVDETITRAVRKASELGVHFLTIHGNGATAEAARRGRGANEFPKIFYVTLLTSLDQFDLMDFGFKKSPHEYVKEKALNAIKHGCDGLICSGQEVGMLRELFRDNTPQPILVCPGIRPAGLSSQDHKRPSTPYDAIVNGADYLVVGRPIRDDANPRQAAERIIEEIQRALDNRK